MPSPPAGWKSTRAIVRCRATPACTFCRRCWPRREATDRPVRDVLAALALGYEIVTRIARCWNAPALVVYTHAQHCCGGRRYGVWLLRRLDPASLLNVLAMASTFVNAGPRNHALSGALRAQRVARRRRLERHAERQPSRVRLRRQCRCAVRCIRRYILGCDDATAGTAADRLGERWTVFDGYTKAYACCQHTHSAARSGFGAAMRRCPPAGEIERQS